MTSWRRLLALAGLLFVMSTSEVYCGDKTSAAATRFKETESDLQVPPVVSGEAGAGRRTRQQLPQYAGTEVYHVLYLPRDWEQGKRYPVVVEYAGNKWKTSTGTVEGSSLGYGLTGGVGAIWVCLPYVNTEERRNQETWWGDVAATVEYCQTAVDLVCDQYGGDREKLYIAGFSRGSIACNFIGLHNGEIAPLWRGFICHSHYDGVRAWPYAGSDRASALKRLQRLKGRPQFISHEQDITATRSYLNEVCPDGNFTFVTLPNTPHTDTWVLKDSEQRRQLRDWFARTLKSASE